LREEWVFLIELQESDSAISKINARKKELPDKLARLESEISAMRKVVDETRTRLDDLQKRRSDKENRLKKEGDALRKAKDRLSEVKTNKEYQAVLKEIETLESINDRIESEIITVLEDVDRLKAEYQTIENDYRVNCEKHEEEKKQVEEDIALLDTKLADAQKRNQDVRRKLQPDLLKKYEMIKQLHKGLAVVSVWKEVCGGCHMNIPPQLYIEMQKNTEIIRCPNCSRFLYRRVSEKND